MKKTIPLLILLVTTNLSFASDSDKQAESFANIYSSTCLKNIAVLGSASLIFMVIRSS